jgi:hypothetical protein
LEGILQRIDEGPDLKAHEHYLTHRVRPEEVNAVKASIVGQWQLDWLHPLAAVLADDRKAQLEQLQTKVSAFRKALPHARWDRRRRSMGSGDVELGAYVGRSIHDRSHAADGAVGSVTPWRIV